MARASFPFLLGTALSGAGGVAAQGAGADADLFNAGQFALSSRENARVIRRQGERLEGAQRAAFAVSGVELSGSPLEVLTETLNISERNAIIVEERGKEQVRQLQKSSRSKRKAAFATGVTSLFSLGGGG